MTKLFFTALLLAAQPALAASIDPAPRQQVHVQVADLNLGSREGVRTLDRRLASAARQVCGANPALSPTERWAANGCRRAALSRARPARDAAIAQRQRGFDQLAAR